ncbi:PEP-CTERM protein-sorting domain-containing protein [Nitrosomonas cryotolerans]|uniref:PEP-CTERM protein-sorting domain-containing protein n=1 Tax=Nitrosomonas cryotolerans ATCC 49181 TaxID=1131553 RepID=A0A1N6HQL3_9PROT|nr:flocculation-associated PEP-CTERM protein PepA [Nitrosomonas cryotolerans]SFQ04954.1 PEP-CTERM protein-sorting domain-containing protein [Nitrosomonas cryotolerans]SIO22104.1 PEP-CTERM protein-sorting domain-containing protein [Nitrosomonas cryotolerans ATCC 49181]
MKLLSNSSKHLMAGAFVAAGLILSSSTALASHIPSGLSFAEEFTVNPGAVGEANASFNARYIDFSYTAEVDQTGFTFAETGGGFFGTFRNSLGGAPILGTGLGVNYQLYALFSGNGTTAMAPGSGVDGTFTGFSVDFFVDLSLDTAFGLSGGSIVTTAGAGEDIKVLSGVLGSHSGGFHVFPGLAAGDFNVEFDATPVGGFFGGTAFAGGSTVGDFNGVNTSVTGVALPPNNFTDAIIIGSGNTSFSPVPVPEPGILFLLGIGLVGMGFVSPRAKEKQFAV